MKGRFKNFNEDRGFGFILGEDGNDYFAHISEVKSMELPYRGAMAEFTPSENEKGFLAKKIIIQKGQSNLPTFVRIGPERIRLNDVKSYVVMKDVEYIQGKRCEYFWLNIKFYSGGQVNIPKSNDFDPFVGARQLDELLSDQFLSK